MDSEIISEIQKYLNSKHERCGILTTKNEIIEITNVSKNSNAFIFSKREWFNLLNQKINILCLWHTHPHSSAEPSEADLKFIKSSKYDMLIVSQKGWRYLHAGLNAAV